MFDRADTLCRTITPLTFGRRAVHFDQQLLEGGKLYHYRMKQRLNGTAWSQGTYER